MSNDPQSGYPLNQPQPGYPQGGYPPEQPRSGCGGCLGKFLIFLGIVFVLIFALCCGGVFYFRSYVTSSISQQPAEVQAIGDEIASLRVPAPLEPVGGGRFKIPFVGTLIAEGAAYSDKEHKCVLILGSFGQALDQNTKDKLLESLKSGQFQQNSAAKDKNDSNEELKDVTKSHVERTIRDQKGNFEITEGVGVRTNKRKIRVQGAFLGKTGPAILIIEAEEGTLSLEKVKELIDSIE